MGLDITCQCKNHEFSMSYGGFYNFREKIWNAFFKYLENYDCSNLKGVHPDEYEMYSIEEYEENYLEDDDEDSLDLKYKDYCKYYKEEVKSILDNVLESLKNDNVGVKEYLILQKLELGGYYHLLKCKDTNGYFCSKQSQEILKFIEKIIEYIPIDCFDGERKIKKFFLYKILNCSVKNNGIVNLW